MKAPLYNYKRQCWVEIDTDTDEQTGPNRYRTADGTPYEMHRDGQRYRNLPNNGEPCVITADRGLAGYGPAITCKGTLPVVAQQE